MTVYSGTCGNLTQVECDDDDGPGAFPRLELGGLTVGETYLIRFYEFSADDEGEFSLVAFVPAPPPIELTCPETVDLLLGDDCEVELPDLTLDVTSDDDMATFTQDSLAGSVLSLIDSSFTQFDVTIMATSPNNPNGGSCVIQVTLVDDTDNCTRGGCGNDQEPPTVSCITDTVLVLDGNGMASLLIEDLLAEGTTTTGDMSLVNFDGMFAPEFFVEQDTPSDDYSDGNLTFTNTTWEVLDQATFPITGISEPNKLAWNTDGITGDAVTLNFAQPASNVTFVIGMVSVNTATEDAAAEVTAEAFGSGGSSLETVVVPGRQAAETVTFSATGIDSIVVTATLPGSPHAGCLDDITYEVSVSVGPISDNCTLADTTITDATFTCDSVGTRMVTITATDEAGNEGTCTVNVTVQDTLAPMLMCQDVTVFLDSMGNGSLSIVGDMGGTGSNAVSRSSRRAGGQ